MNVFPFIEAEKVEQHDTVKRSCELLEVSRSAFYEWHQHIPSARQAADDELGARIRTDAEPDGLPAGAGAALGTSVLGRGDWLAGLYFGIHTRTFDGGR